MKKDRIMLVSPIRPSTHYYHHSVQFKMFFIVNPHIKKTYNDETFHGHCYNAQRAKLTRRKNDYGIIIVSTIH